MRYSELVRCLERLGCQLSRQGAGSHQLWINPRIGNRTVIAYHATREVPPGTLRAILRQLGLSPEDLNAT